MKQIIQIAPKVSAVVVLINGGHDDGPAAKRAKTNAVLLSRDREELLFNLQLDQLTSPTSAAGRCPHCSSDSRPPSPPTSAIRRADYYHIVMQLCLEGYTTMLLGCVERRPAQQSEMPFLTYT